MISEAAEATLLEAVREDLTQEAFRDAVARLAGGVGIAACWADEGPVGLLVSSIAVLSVDPPRVLFCVRKAARSHAALFRARHCSLNILTENDQAEAERFSDPGRTHERFDATSWSLRPQGPPHHRTPLIGLIGTIRRRMDAGTHTVFVVDVSRADVSDAKPLLYFNRRYAGLHALAQP
jgi:flavin reductase